MALASPAHPHGVRRLHRRYGAVAILGSALLTLGLTGCGGSAASQSAPPPSESPTSPATSPTGTTSAAPEPLSPFESKPEVKVVRKWASAIAKDINARAKSLPRAAAFETADGRARIPQIAQEDIGLHYPGPLPLTPVHVSENGSSATVNVCAMVQGWARDPKTGKPARKHSIHPIDIPLQKVDGAWRVDSFQTGQADCSSVKVTGVPW